MRKLFVVYDDAIDHNWASYRIRALWPAAHMDDVMIVRASVAAEIKPVDYDAYILIKIGIVDLQKMWLDAGKQVWWDVCDPSWWFSPHDVREVISNVTGMVTSNVGLSDDLAEFSGRHVNTIPDRIMMSHYGRTREHTETDPVRLIWYGAYQNRGSLFGSLCLLERLVANGRNVSLTIFDDRPDDVWNINRVPVYHAKWSAMHESDVISGHDIALLPKYPGQWGRVKSNNRHLTAWACGLPVSDGSDYGELERLVDSHVERSRSAEDGMDTLIDGYTADVSADDWSKLLCES